MTAERPDSGPTVPAADTADETRPDTAAPVEAATGHPRVDAAMSQLRRVAQLPPVEQVEGYTHVQRELSETLAGIDDGR